MDVVMSKWLRTMSKMLHTMSAGMTSISRIKMMESESAPFSRFETHGNCACFTIGCDGWMCGHRHVPGSGMTSVTRVETIEAMGTEDVGSLHDQDFKQRASLSIGCDMDGCGGVGRHAAWQTAASFTQHRDGSRWVRK